MIGVSAGGDHGARLGARSFEAQRRRRVRTSHRRRIGPQVWNSQCRAFSPVGDIRQCARAPQHQGHRIVVLAQPGARRLSPRRPGLARIHGRGRPCGGRRGQRCAAPRRVGRRGRQSGARAGHGLRARSPLLPLQTLQTRGQPWQVNGQAQAVTPRHVPQPGVDKAGAIEACTWSCVRIHSHSQTWICKGAAGGPAPPPQGPEGRSRPGSSVQACRGPKRPHRICGPGLQPRRFGRCHLCRQVLQSRRAQAAHPPFTRARGAQTLRQPGCEPGAVGVVQPRLSVGMARQHGMLQIGSQGKRSRRRFGRRIRDRGRPRRPAGHVVRNRRWRARGQCSGALRLLRRLKCHHVQAKQGHAPARWSAPDGRNAGRLDVQQGSRVARQGV